MTKFHRILFGSLAVLLALAMVSPAQATNGYFTHGYGAISKALAGAGVAMPQDTLASATNPAGMVVVGKRYDAGLAVFSPDRSYTVTGNPSGFPGTFGLTPGKVESDSNYFYIPHFGGNWRLGENMTLGVTVYAHGGMNTDYPTATFYAGEPTGVNLEQLMVGIPWAVRFADKHSIGIMPIIAYQTFEAKGVGSFAPFSSDPAKLSNNGKSTSIGYGAKIGYLGQFTEKFSFGISYQTEISADKFDDYAGLFAEQGRFNIPPSLTAGIAIKATPALSILADYQDIYYSEVKSVSNPFLPNLQTARLGDNEGAGFGWQDMSVWKFGLQYDPESSWVWRFGYSFGDQPIPESEVLFNILAPGVMEDHFTFGFTRQFGESSGLNFALMYAPEVEVTGPNPLEVPGLQDITLAMSQWDIEISYSWGF